jgi:hypothetical protein
VYIRAVYGPPKLDDQTPAQAIFLAVRPGTATLDATDDIGCLHTQPSCTVPQQQWRVTVIVG